MHDQRPPQSRRLDQPAALAGLILLVVLALCSAAALAWIVRDASQRARRAAVAGATTHTNAILRDIFDVMMFRTSQALSVGFVTARATPPPQGPALLEALRRDFGQLRTCECPAALQSGAFFLWSESKSQSVVMDDVESAVVQHELGRQLSGLDSASLIFGNGYNVLPVQIGDTTRLWFMVARGDGLQGVRGAAAEVSLASLREQLVEPAFRRVVRDRLPAGADTAFHFLLVGPFGDTLFGAAPPREAISSRIGFWGRDLHFENPLGRAFIATLWADASSFGILGLESGIGRSERWAVPLLLISIGLAGAALVLVVRVRRYDQERSVFASAIAHDLRTPLTKILLYAEALAAPAAGERTRSDAGGVIAREARRMILQVENALRFVAPRSSKAVFDPQPTVVGTLVQDVVDEMRPMVEQRQMQITSEVDSRVRSAIDSGAVRQIVMNLIDNAMRYGPSGQTIKVTVVGDDGFCVITVADEGPGVPPAERERVFTPFVRGAQSPTGTGLGLAHRTTVSSAA